MNLNKEQLQEAQQRFKDLLNFYIVLALEKFAQDLRITFERLLKIIEDKEPIDSNIAKKLRYLWQIKLGTVYVPAPKPELKPLECSIFDIVFELVGKGKIYKVANIKDVLPQIINDVHYDGALLRVTPDINNILFYFFKENFEFEKTKGISSGITTVCPEYRKFELELFDNQELQYFLIYGKGILIDSTDSLQSENIISVLKREGKWEE